MALSNAETRARYYERYREKHITSVRTLQNEKKQFLRDLKEATPCTDCGQRYPSYVMHFDHVGEDKAMNLSVAHKLGWETIRVEVAKCEIVCANCHAIRTYERGYKN